MYIKFIVYSVWFIVLSFVLTINYLPSTIYAAESSASAQESNIGYSRIDPTSFFYSLKTLRETLELKLALTEKVRNLRQLEFATRRLREAKALLGKDESLIPPTLERYSSHIDRVKEQNQMTEDFKIEVKNNFAVHLKVLESIYEKSKDTRSKMYIRSAMNKLIGRKEVSNLSKESICKLFEKESSSSALNQTEQVVLKTRSDQCYKSLVN